MFRSRGISDFPLAKLESKQQAVRKIGFDQYFIHALQFHFEVVNQESENPSLTECCNILLSKHFFDNMDSYPTERFRSQINENSGWPVTLLPTELFGENRLSIVYRKSRFYSCLQIGDILHCRVASIHPTEYQLRVIHKYGATRMLDDLNITVVMRRTQVVLLVLEKDLLLSELIRVAVSNVEKLSEDETKIYVTVDQKSLEIKPLGQSLGRISEENLPSYVLNPPEFTPDATYSDYLNNSTAFRNPLSLNHIFEGFGLNLHGIYTFYPVDERLKPVDGKELMKEAKFNVVKSYTYAVQQEVDKGNLQNAVNLIEKAIQSYPMEDMTKNEKIELSKLYELKGNYYSELGRTCEEGMKNWKLAKKTDPSHERSKKHFANLAFAAAMKFYRNKDYQAAADLAKAALRIDKTFLQSLTLLEHLRERHPEVFNDLEDESLSGLQKKRQELVNELIKQGINFNNY